MDKKIIAILRLFYLLSWSYDTHVSGVVKCKSKPLDLWQIWYLDIIFNQSFSLCVISASYHMLGSMCIGGSYNAYEHSVLYTAQISEHTVHKKYLKNSPLITLASITFPWFYWYHKIISTHVI